MKKQLLVSLLASMVTLTPCFAGDQKDTKKDDTKKAIEFKAGDGTLTISGKTKVEHYFQRNMALLNSCVPDEYNYFKNQFDLTFNFAYGKQTFGHDAVKAVTNIRHKGVWGRGAVFADSDGMSPAPVRLSDSLFGGHSHTSGKPLVWINEAWLLFSFNAIANSDSDLIHTLKLGWFPFELGRGIALGSVYGLNREGFGLNTYVEDKSAPGINLHGDLIKDRLSYDLYYAKFECRSKSMGDTFNGVKEQLIGRKLSPWRGVAKDNDLIAGRLKWKALDKSKFGTLEFEPYGFYQAASDQKINVIADSKTELTTLGLLVEHAYKGFEFGVEGAFNLGVQEVRAVDKNKIDISRNNDGYMVEQFTHIIVDPAPIDPLTKNARVTNESKKASQVIVTSDTAPLTSGFVSKSGRITPAYINQLRGFMVVTDIAYKFEDYNLTLAGAYGFASGDENPHQSATCKTHMGFVGVHEAYCGKRVSSLMFLGEMRGVLSIPGSLTEYANTVDNNELSFTNLHHCGFGATWKPTFWTKKWNFEPNMLAFWRAFPTKTFDTKTEKTTCNNADRYIGTEFNLKSKVELLKDLNMYGNFGFFVPGGFFNDIQGIPFKNAFEKVAGTSDFFDQLSDETGVETDTLKQKFRLSTDVAYSVNFGLTYAF